MEKLYKNFLLPGGLLAGTVIGAGMFALPSLFVKSGLLAGAVALAFGAGVYLLIHLLYADLIVRSPGEHRFAGYAKLYLGRAGFWLAAAVAILEMVSVLTIYLILSVSFSNLIFPGSPEVKLIFFWALGSAAMFLSVKRLALAEFLIVAGMIAIVAGIVALGIPRVARVTEVGVFGGWGTLFFPLGPALFALSGRVAIPSTVAYFRERGVLHSRRALRSVITLGTLVPAAVYALFAVAVLSLSSTVSDDSVTGLIGSIPSWALVAVGALGLTAIWSSYITAGIDTKSVFHYDLRVPPSVAAAVAVAAPLLLYFAGFQNFIELVSFVGGIFLALEGLLVIAMWWSAKRFEPHHPPLLGKVPAIATGAAALLFTVVMFREIFQYVSAHWFR